MRPRWLLAFVPTFTLLAAFAAEGEAAEPLTSGIDRANFDPSVRFQDDLFHAVNGGWLAKTEIPATAPITARSRSSPNRPKRTSAPSSRAAPVPARTQRTLKRRSGTCTPRIWTRRGPSGLASNPSPTHSRRLTGLRPRPASCGCLPSWRGSGSAAWCTARSLPMPSDPIGTSSISPRGASASRTATTTGTPSTRRSWRATGCTLRGA